jgi:hypothetical protein
MKIVKLQSWARAFFGSSRLRFRAPDGILSHWRFRTLFWALNFALLRSRSRAFALLVFCARIFALLDFRARTFALLISFRATDFLSRSRFPFAHVCLYIYTHTQKCIHPPAPAETMQGPDPTLLGFFNCEYLFVS